MFDLYRKYGFKINVLSNGIALSPEKADILKNNLDCINEILLNVPSIDKDRWAKYTNMNSSIFDKVISNLDYAYGVIRSKMIIMVNGLNNNSMLENGGWVTVLNNAPELDLDVENGSLNTELSEIRMRFPEIPSFSNHHLYDRAGHLEDVNVITQSPAINKYMNTSLKVVGCRGGLVVKDRQRDWIHIAIWAGHKREDAILKAQETLCRRCSAAIWG
jgi:hypothetical protein